MGMTNKQVVQTFFASLWTDPALARDRRRHLDHDALDADPGQRDDDPPRRLARGKTRRGRDYINDDLFRMKPELIFGG